MSNLATVPTSEAFHIDRAQAMTITEKVIAENGNLYQLTGGERKLYYLAMCDRYGLDPYSNPFDYMKGKDRSGNQILTLYPNKKAAEQFGYRKRLDVRIVEKTITDGTAIVTVIVTDNSRVIEEIGAVEITSYVKAGDALKKALTQARRRGILAFCGFSPDGHDDNAIPSEALDHGIEATVVDAAILSEPSTFDRQPTMDAITAGIKRLGWSKKQGSEYLQRAYGKPTRDQLTDAELTDFADYLESFKAQPEVAQAESIDVGNSATADEFPALD
ncbi:MAG: hypothetical protein KME27_10965 [Lyngbya sp. HA4199-MV5]|jgi:hypothetical protein|nr:hypothetical protein [Lyngbya sp. HA4199-MV5]